MTQPAITSLRNPRIVDVAKLHDRRHRLAAGLTIVEGPHLVADAATGGAAIVELYATPESPPLRSAIPATVVSPAVLERIAGTAHPRGPVAVVRIPAPGQLRSTPTVVLWGVGDPGNVGAIIRSAAAFGFAVAVVEGSADPWAPKTIRAAAAAQFHTNIIPLRAEDALDQLAAAGLELCVAVPAGGIAPESLAGAARALIIGNEAHGLPDTVQARADHRLSIPMPGAIDSLNAAVAAGILLYLLRTPTQ